MREFTRKELWRNLEKELFLAREGRRQQIDCESGMHAPNAVTVPPSHSKCSAVRLGFLLLVREHVNRKCESLANIEVDGGESWVSETFRIIYLYFKSTTTRCRTKFEKRLFMQDRMTKEI
ncbi:hypothetical protein OUZ56_000162 [Daphnia magna]|uniref:Uncharacterized protein n=1 Tax=Daphnia magna TaxID=35525 RepID=A0ABQ9ZYV4_9CRUS|nr:hypothetical protein OUZ56_000162 [Daphnia magna]